ncbi:MAG: hypothetical protein C5B55_02700 [Blastocatellia bacterium]|nr:MAG: hypothetical protein C5B55_02700 [Blastocatellia bacterium]
MPKRFGHFYEFGPFRLDPERHRLLRDGEPVPLSPKSIEALLILVKNAGRLLERETLMEAVWTDAFVEDANLTVAISHLRKALGQNTEEAEYIETIPRVGYRFVAEVREVNDELKPLIIEKHTRSRTVIEEELSTDNQSERGEGIVVTHTPSTVFARTVNLEHILLAAGAAVFLALGSFFYFRHGDERGIAAGKSPASIIRVLAVLPPQPLNDQELNASLSVGIADALIVRLGRVGQLVVRPTSAVVRYVDSSEDRMNAGKALGVDAVLDGSLQRDGGRVRVQLRLLSVATGDQLWARAFDESDTDIFKLEDSISQQLGSALSTNLSPTERVALSKRETTNPEAYALYIKGNYFWSKRGNEAAKSIDYFRKAIELDPNFAQAYASLAAVDSTTTGFSPEAEALVEKALQLDGQLAEAHATLGFIKMFHHWDWVTAEKELDRAIELDPNSAIAHHWKGVYLSIRGRLDEAKAEMHRALDLDPLSLIILADIGQLHYFAHEYDLAIDYCKRVLAVDPDFWVAHEYLVDIYRAKGMDEEVFNELLKTDFRSSPPEVIQHERELYNRGGIRDIFEERLNYFLKDGDHSSIGTARYYSRLGDKEHALQWLDRAASHKTFFWNAYIGVDPLYDSLHDDARFKEIIHRLNL